MRARTSGAPLVARPRLVRAFVGLLPEQAWGALAALGSFGLAWGLGLRLLVKRTSTEVPGALGIGVGALLLCVGGGLAAGARHFRRTSTLAVVIVPEARLLDESGTPLAHPPQQRQPHRPRRRRNVRPRPPRRPRPHRMGHHRRLGHRRPTPRSRTPLQLTPQRTTTHPTTQTHPKRNRLQRHRPSAIGHRPSAIGHRPSAIGHRPSAIGHRPSVISHRSSVIGHRSSLISHRSSVIAHRSSLICHRPSAHRPSAIARRDAFNASGRPPPPPRHGFRAPCRFIHNLYRQCSRKKGAV